MSNTTSSTSTRTLPFDLEAAPPEELVPGMTFQYLFNRQAIQFVASNSSRPVTDAWVDKVRAVAKDWPKDQTIFILNDFSCKDCVQTPYGRARSQELMKADTGLKVVSVMVVQNNLTMQLSRLFIRAVQRPYFRIHLTFNRDDGLIWLKKHIDEYRAQSKNLSK
jgi:hypothetical protein